MHKAGAATYGQVKVALAHIAYEAARHNVTVKVVAPGIIHTPMHGRPSEETEAWHGGRIPLGRIGQPQDLVGATVFLSSDAAAYITGQVLHVNGGMIMSDWEHDTPAPHFRHYRHLDGVAYRGDAPIPEPVRAFQHWHEQGLPYAFVTNNSTKSAEEFAAKLNGMDIPVTPERIVTTSAAVAERLHETISSGSRVMVIGAASLVAAVQARGFEIVDTDVSAVVAGLDRAFTFEKLQKAQTALLGGACFFGTNPDRMLPHEDGYEPGAGSILAAIETASGVVPAVIGKPQPDLIRMALEVLGSDPETTFMLGDQIETDIIAGQAAGLKTILVRTGVPSREVPGVTADIDIQSLSDLTF